MTNPKPGDLVGLFATRFNKFRVGLFLDESRIAVLYERGSGADNQLLDLLAKRCSDAKSLGLIETKNEIAFGDFLRMAYELYNLNVFAKAKEFNSAPSEYIDIIKHNLNKLDEFQVGDIIKFEGYRAFGSYVLYHHHAIFTDEERCKVINKSGEPDLKSMRVIESIVSEDGLLEKASFRKIHKETTFEGTYAPRPVDEILASAKKRLGEREYNVVTDNCQHFATDCRYGTARSVEVEQTAVAGALAAGAVAAIATVVYKYWGSSNNSKNEDKKEKTIINES